MASATLVQISTSPHFTEGTILVDKSMEWSSGMVSEVDINALGGEDNITPDTKVYARAQYRHHTTGGSGWGPAVSFGLAAHRTLTTGVCLVKSGVGITKPTWKRIDLEGKLILDPFDHKQHKLYTSKIFQTIDNGNEMIVFKTIYVKCLPQGIPGTDTSGHACWWLSTHKWDETWKPCSTFVRNNTVKSQIMIAKNLGSILNSKLVSSSTALIATNKTKQQWKEYIAANNTEGVTGYRMFDYHDYSFLKLLFLVFNGEIGLNAAEKWKNLSSEAAGSFVGIKDLWGDNYWTWVDKIAIGVPSSNRFNVMNTESNTVAFAADHGLAESYFDRTFGQGEVTVSDVPRNTMEYLMPIDQVIDKTNVTETALGGYLEGTSGEDLMMGRKITFTVSGTTTKTVTANLFNLHRGNDATIITACRMCKS